jgi:hypothetical protein
MAKMPSEGRKVGLSNMENGKGLPFRKRVGDGNFTIFRKILNQAALASLYLVRISWPPEGEDLHLGQGPGNTGEQ